jgi:ethanolamine-phosphate cytidylyltransferase
MSVPSPGSWPVDPQEDVPVSDDRIWIDGCFDFAHHGKFPGQCCLQNESPTNFIASKGHAGAMLQARQLGNELYVGVHSDEAILENKGPTVMVLQER